MSQNNDNGELLFIGGIVTVVLVNLIAVNFYRQFFSGKFPYIVMGTDKRLKLQKNINICDFVSSYWDETKVGNENIYTGERASLLLKEIEKRIVNPNPNQISKETLINRNYIEASDWDQILAGSGFYKESKSIKFSIAKDAIFKFIDMPDLDPKKMKTAESRILQISP